ncbi:MAG: lamin tail domain-containing protein [Balneola sp.]|nr:lamin tail domain-containing protein [Balneola sp.]MBO6712804.1 lamin tail domain-containing protein [Balneola sp.]MBO6801103.1 lamin tail domain-containing protein [Balneola sp.]MBO6871295.1 lamin tail domain-containing protein [Balneola sp.]
MRGFIIVILIFIPSLIVAQSANFQDDFTDQDISDWIGDNADFTFVTESGNVLLQQNAASAGSSQLSISSTNVVGFWEFFIRLDGFNPSNGNKSEIYLMSDSANFDQAIDGYMLQAGEDGSGDVFRLFRITDGAKDGEVLTGTTDISSGGDFRVRVDRDASGSWALSVASSYSGVTVQEATGTDNTYSSTSFFGFKNTYTSTRADKFFFDFKIDIPPIQVVDASLLNASTINVTFSKDYDPATIQNSDFTISPGNLNPTTIDQPSSSSVELVFGSNLPSGSFDLGITSIEDSNNQTTLTDTTITLFRFEEYQTGDIIINEFLKDPPGVLEEYVELKNTSSRLLNLKDWELGDNGSLSVISDQDFAIFPDSFVVITSDTAALKSVFGNVYCIQVSLPAFNNTTDQIRLYDENGTTIDSLEYTPDWGGDNVALERRSPTTPSVFMENWDDSPNPNSGTAGMENEVAQDNTSPNLETLSIVNDSTFILTFTERINSDSAGNPDNYEIALNTKAVQGENDFFVATFLEPDSVKLVVKGGIPNTPSGGEIVIYNQADIFGNINPSISRTFQYIQTETAEPGDVFINEFVYDPPGSLTEFVEIYNPTDKAFNLKGWTLSDNSGNEVVLTNEDYFFRKTEPTSGFSDNPYIILTPDSSISVGQPNRRVVMGSRFPILNNTTDAIILKNADGVTIDSLTYTQDWGGDEVSLERRSVSVTGQFQENWGDSPSAQFATPSEPNLVSQDNTAPTLENAFALNNTSIVLIYDERLEQSAAQNVSNYSFSPSLSVSSISQNRNQIILIFNEPLQNETTYSITINDQQDIFGNTNAQISTSVRYLEFSASQPSDIVINEILYQKENENSPEFVELFNRTDNNFDLSNWTISDAADNSATLPEGTSLEAGSYVVLTDRQSFASSLSNGIFLSGFPSLNDSGDGIIIKNESGATIDSLFYTERFGGNQDGVSAEKKDPDGASNDPNNWNSNTSESGNSAGVENSVFQLDTISPEIIFARLQENGNVVIAFSEFVDLSGSTISADGQQRSVLNFSSTEANKVTVDGSGLTTNEHIEVSITNLADVVGNVNSSTSGQISQKITPGSVIINEILYDPLSDDEDNLPDQTEYIELYNTQDYPISLEEIFLNDAPDEDNEVNRLDPVSSQFKWIQPNGYFLIYAEDQTFDFFESQLAEYFGLESQSDQFTMQIDRSSLSLSASGDAIFISDSSGTAIDSVFYDESWQNPNRVSVDGVALEKINPAGPSNDESNWSSSTEVSGGTPGQQNSIFQEPGSAPDNSGITFTPNPFSPDDDGFEDFLSINYTLDEADYLLRVRIYDRYGREVRELVDGKAAGFSGSLIWDGLTDAGNKNRVGIYIVLFEAYNSAAGRDRTFKETVVIARKF